MNASGLGGRGVFYRLGLISRIDIYLVYLGVGRSVGFKLVGLGRVGNCVFLIRYSDRVVGLGVIVGCI